MVLDIALGVLLFIFAALGYQKGFMRSAIGLLKTSASVIFAIFLSKPISIFLDGIFKFSRLIGKIFIPSIADMATTTFLTEKAVSAATAEQLSTIKGQGAVGFVFEKIVRAIIKNGGNKIAGFASPAAYAASGLGFFVLLVMVAVLLFIGIRVLLKFLNRVIDKLTENNAVLRIDQWLGFVFGIIKFAFNLFIFFGIVFIVSSIPFLNGISNWLFTGSTVGKWLYGATGDVLLFILNTFNVFSVVAKTIGL